MSMMVGRVATAVALVLGVIPACEAGSEPSGAGGSSATDSGSGNPVDACELLADRASCCADSSCGWHESGGHLPYGVARCVNRERVCEVDGQKVRDCQDGMKCIVSGGWTTEDDCAQLPPTGQVNLKGRGICVPPDQDAGAQDGGFGLPPECPPEGC